MKKFFENKSLAYWIAVADTALAIILGIIYMATYKNAIGNNAAGNVPESVGIYLLAGGAVNAILCLLPQYSFISIIVVGLYGLSLFKEVFLIPDFIAGLANGVEYNGGSAAMNIFYFVGQLIIIISAIAAMFIGYYKKDESVAEEEKADFKNIKGGAAIGKVAGGAAVVVVAVLASLLAVNSLKDNAGTNQPQNQPEQKEETQKWSPLTDSIVSKCQSYDYDFDPTSVIIKQKAADEYDYNDSTLSALTKSRTREGQHIVYAFEGVYSEGYQGQYNEYYLYMWLWDDGVYFGTSTSNNSYNTWKGFWYNSSLTDGKDENGNDIADCLVMISKSEDYQSIICEPSNGFYQYQAYVYFNPGFARRSIIANGYYYYPTVALAIEYTDSQEEALSYKVGESFSLTGMTLNRILKNQKFGACFNMRDLDTSKDNSCADYIVSYEAESGALTNGKFTAAGSYDITIKWGGLEIVVTAKVSE